MLKIARNNEWTPGSYIYWRRLNLYIVIIKTVHRSRFIESRNFLLYNKSRSHFSSGKNIIWVEILKYHWCIQQRPQMDDNQNWCIVFSQFILFYYTYTSWKYLISCASILFYALLLPQIQFKFYLLFIAVVK